MGLERIDTLDDAALAEACRKGDTKAFECLVHRHQRMLLNVAFRMTGVYEDACDIVQDAFIAAWRKIGDFRGEAQFSTWMTSIVINLSRSRLQQRQLQDKRNAYSLDAANPGGDGDMIPDPSSNTLSALQQMEEAEIRQALQSCIDALTPEFREVLVLRDMQDMPYDQVASALSLKEGTVKSRLFRARDTVKDCVRKVVGRP
jgi:RNA polymerase sigma-70 factor (ECF subfamily)